MILVEEMSGAWGAPFCVLIDRGMFAGDVTDERNALWTLGHELAHTWWGNSVAMRGLAGYLHEGLANYMAIALLGERFGAELEADYEALLLRRYCDADEPLPKPLAELRLTEGDSYVRGNYNLGGLFYCAMDDRLGRERTLELLGAFAVEYGGRAADLATLEAFLVEEHEAPVADLFEDWVHTRNKAKELFRRRDELAAEAKGYWSERTPVIDPDLEALAQARLDEILDALAHGYADEPDEAALRRLLREEWAEIGLPHAAQVTALHEDGTYAYHVADLDGDALWYSDVRGSSVYRRILEADSERGSFAYFGFLSSTGERARQTSLFHARLERPPWVVILELHEQKARGLEGRR